MDRRIPRASALRPAAFAALVTLTAVAAARLLGATNETRLLAGLSAADQRFLVAGLFLAHSLAVGAVAEGRTGGYVLGSALGLGWLAALGTSAVGGDSGPPSLDVALALAAVAAVVSSGVVAFDRLLLAPDTPGNVTDIDEWRSRAAVRRRRSGANR